MHELAIAADIVRIAQEIASEQGAIKVTNVTLDVGGLSGIMPEALYFSFETVAARTVCEGSGLTINTISPLAHCPTCERDFTPDSRWFVCPGCHGPAAMIKGDELSVHSVDIE